jgi:hypothetical protein
MDGELGDRVRLNASISRRAHLGWRTFAAEHGVTVAAFCEVVGRLMLDDPERVARSAITRELIAQARVLAAERRERDL